MSNMSLEVSSLKVEFDTYGGIVKAVRGVDFEVQKGKTLAIVGESGCGKSVTVQSILGLIPTPPGRITAGSAKLNGKELLGLPTKELNSIRGRDVGVIFQDPMSSLNPLMTVVVQIAEGLQILKGLSRKEAFSQAIDIMKQVNIPSSEARAKHYPFQFSGGMRQRIMIALAIACGPQLLIADEPTTALDVTIQAQILNLLKALQKKNNMAMVLITHDLGVVAKMADDVAVMYAGQIIEYGSVDDIFFKSKHPYTVGLRSALPGHDRERKKLIPIEGSPPDLFDPPRGCGYFARCPHAMKICETEMPPEFDLDTQYSRCWLMHDDNPNKGVL